LNVKRKYVQICNKIEGAVLFKLRATLIFILAGVWW
jgi:hypothetical protein